MPAKTTTQILNIRWQERSWQPRIRRTPARSVAALVESRLRTAVPPASVRPCGRGRAASFVRHMILALRPRRRKQS